MASKSNEHIQEQTSHLSSLTVENVTKLELEFEAIDGVLQERQKVEKYIRNTQQSEELQRSLESSLPTVQEQDSQSLLRSRTNTVEDGNKKEMLTSSDSVTKKTSKIPSSKSMKKQTANVGKCICKYTQTDGSWHDISPAVSKSAGTPEPDDINTKMSTSKAAEQCSITGENTMRSQSSNSENVETPGQLENPLHLEDDPLKQAEADPTLCEFCAMPKKPFPSVEQLVSEASVMLFCCVKSQELFQYLIMNSIELYTPEEAEEKYQAETPIPPISNKMETLHGLREDTVFYTPEEAEEKNGAETPLPEISNQMKALHGLREELKKINTEEYITSLVHHMKFFGSLFIMEKITFTLASNCDKIPNNIQSAESYSDPVHNIDDYFINIPILDNKPIKWLNGTINECYNSGQNFVNLFPDGTGQVLYPSGNIGILIACSKPTQFTFIILEDAEQNPQIQAVFMSNGHAACYHLNGMLWTVLDPCGGSYFDEKGIWKKQWTWWDFSRHVHAPPFQSITLKLNLNIEVKMLTQDEIYLSFTKEKEKVTFNVGSKLLLKYPKNIFQLKSRIGETECYLCSKKIQIYSLLKNVRSLVRISNSPQSTIETIQEYICQLQKSLNYINKLASKQINCSNVLKTESTQENIITVKKKRHPHPNGKLTSKTVSLNVPNKKKGTTNGSKKQKIKLQK
ncbi:glutamate-rich protein 6B [Mixophyes fleayi]|uniref:glutamate-rich protein 6B n=1 Tax=Mixophyes fleayi TaxID=3061075 RepID=UPI003F4DBA9F